MNREDDEHYDIMLEIFATCLRARQNANNFIREGMQHSVREIVKYTRVENRRYRPILKIMERIISYCEESKRKEIADFFMDGSDSSVFYVQILEQVTKSLNYIEANNGKIDETGGIVIQMEKYETLKCEIELLGALLHGNERNRILGFEEEKEDKDGKKKKEEEGKGGKKKVLQGQLNPCIFNILGVL